MPFCQIDAGAGRWDAGRGQGSRTREHKVLLRIRPAGGTKFGSRSRNARPGKGVLPVLTGPPRSFVPSKSDGTISPDGRRKAHRQHRRQGRTRMEGSARGMVDRRPGADGADRRARKGKGIGLSVRSERLQELMPPALADDGFRGGRREQGESIAALRTAGPRAGSRVSRIGGLVPHRAGGAHRPGAVLSGGGRVGQRRADDDIVAAVGASGRWGQAENGQPGKSHPEVARRPSHSAVEPCSLSSNSKGAHASGGMSKEN